MESQFFKLSVFVTFLLIFNGCQKDESETFQLIGQEVEVNETSISAVLSDYKAFVLINSEEVEFTENFILPIKLGNDYYWNIHLMKNSLTTFDSSSNHYEGNIVGNQSNTVRISFYDNIINGFIIEGDKCYNIRAVQSFPVQSDKYQNVILVFEDKDIIKQDWNM